MSAGAQIDWQNDPGFQQLPLAEKHKALLAIDPGYRGLPPGEQVKALTTIHYGKEPEGMPENYGFTAEKMGSTAWKDVKDLAGGAYGMGKDILFPEGITETDKLKWLAKKYIFDPSDVEMQKAQTAKTGWESVGHSIAGAIPLVGPWAASRGEQAGTGDIGGALAGTLAQGLAAKGLGMAAEGVKGIPGKAQPLLQKYWNVGPELTKTAVEERAAQVGELTDKYQAKTAEVQRANQAARQTSMDRGQLVSEAQGHAQELAEHLPKLAEQERAYAKSLYPEVDGTADAAELHGKLQGSLGALAGSEKAPTILTRIMKELEPTTPLEGFPPEVKARIIQSMPEGVRAAYEGEPLDFNRLHGYFSELGRELSRDLPGDERAAISSARAEIEGQMRKLAETDGKFGQFSEAQANWKKYENTFNKSWSDSRGVASPIARALQAKNPVTGEVIPERVAQILSDPKNYKLAQQMLSKYEGAKTDVLQLMKEKLDQAGTMPKTLKESPLPAAPEMPEAVDPQALKVAALTQTAQGLRSMKGIRGSLDVVALVHALSSGNPLALLYPAVRRALSYGIESPRVMDYLSKPSEAELQMVNPSKVYPSAKVAAAAANSPSGPKYLSSSLVGGGTATLGDVYRAIRVKPPTASGGLGELVDRVQKDTGAPRAQVESLVRQAMERKGMLPGKAGYPEDIVRNRAEIKRGFYEQ